MNSESNKPKVEIGCDNPNADSPNHFQAKKDYNLPPAAQRALKEAEFRRKTMDEENKMRTREINGRGGLDPVRFHDWEVKGLAVDF